MTSILPLGLYGPPPKPAAPPPSQPAFATRDDTAASGSKIAEAATSASGGATGPIGEPAGAARGVPAAGGSNGGVVATLEPGGPATAPRFGRFNDADSLAILSDGKLPRGDNSSEARAAAEGARVAYKTSAMIETLAAPPKVLEVDGREQILNTAEDAARTAADPKPRATEA